MVGALLLLWMNQSMLNKIPSAVFTLVGLLRLSGIVLARSNFTTLEAISASNESALASAGVTGAAIAASAVIVVFRYGFGEGSSTNTTQPAACIPDKQKAAIASCATDLTLRSPIQPDLNNQSSRPKPWPMLLGLFVGVGMAIA